MRCAAPPNASFTSPSPSLLLTSAPRSTTPRAARLIARGYTWFIRRTIAIVSPLRRAIEAWNLIASSPGMPASTTRPPGRTDSTASRTASSLPAASNATSTPGPVRSTAPGSPTTSAPYRAAASRRCASGSTASTELAPAAFSTAIRSSPIGPHPTTDAVPANGRCPRSRLWMATPSGSSSAPSALETPSGSGCSNSAGHVMNSRIMPSVSPCPANRIR